MSKRYPNVLVTGCTGFLGRHVTQEFLSRGYNVRGTTRSPEEQHQSIRSDFEHSDALELRTLDLTMDDGWSKAMAGMDAVIHTASPFSAYEPKDEMELIGPARDGTLRVLNTAFESGIRKFVITSSTAAISGATRTGTAPACCLLSLKTASGLSAMWSTCWMCPCISSTGMASISIVQASPSGIS